MSGDAGTASTMMLNASDTSSGMKPINTSRFAVSRP
jgi:hypothetical protein